MAGRLDKLLILLVLGLCALGARLSIPRDAVSPPSPSPVSVSGLSPASVRTLSLSGVRLGDPYESVVARWGRLEKKVICAPNVWMAHEYGPFSKIVFLQQARERDLWVVVQVCGTSLNDGQAPLLSAGDLDSGLVSLLGDSAVTSRCGMSERRYTVDVRERYEVGGNAVRTGLLLVRTQAQRFTETELIGYDGKENP